MRCSDFSRVIELVESVGSKVLSWQRNKTSRKVYSKEKFKTEADSSAHKLLLKGLRQIFPNTEVISEEDSSFSDDRPENYWIIDPIDGTASWFEGFPGFVTQAAYIENNMPVFGVVNAPAFRKTWTGLIGMGAWLNGKRLPRLQAMSNRLALIDNYPQPKKAAGIINKSMPVTEYIESGSIGLKCVLVADGTADLFVKDVAIRDWDIAPAVPIILEAGGVFILIDGKPYNFIGSLEKENGIVVARDLRLAKMAAKILRKRHDKTGS